MITLSPIFERLSVSEYSINTLSKIPIERLIAMLFAMIFSSSSLKSLLKSSKEKLLFDR
jgi:hypothetical protein